MTLPTLRTVLLGATGAALMATVMACSSGAPQADSPAAPESTAQSTTTSEQAPPGDREAFRDCMAAHGVTLPEHAGGGHPGHPDGPPPDGATPPAGAPPSDGQAPPAPPGVDQDTWDSAHQACAALAPAHQHQPQQ